MKFTFAASRLRWTRLLTGLALVSAAGVAFAAPDHSNSTGRQMVLRVQAGQLPGVLAQHQLTLVDASGLEISGSELVLVEGKKSPGEMLAALAADGRAAGAEVAAVAALPAEGPTQDLLTQASFDLQRTGTAATSCQEAFLGASWAGFSDQRAFRTIRLADAHLFGSGCGVGVTVAVIDTGIDETHPLLAPALIAGFDFIENAEQASDWSNLDHSVRAIVEHSVRAIVEESNTAVIGGGGTVALNAGMGPLLGTDGVTTLQSLGLPPYFGHGTMVAGLIHAVAPGAKIMPLRAFDGQGVGNVYDVVRAIRYAVDHGARVINMSFSMAESSRELQDALRYARSQGVVLIAAAGNQGEKLRIYPAAFPEALGVASTGLDGKMASFSNWGAQIAALAAPGTALITLFPGDLFAAGSGTSFSTPLAAGTAALLLSEAPGDTALEAELDLLMGSVFTPALNGKVQAGRLDAKWPLYLQRYY